MMCQRCDVGDSLPLVDKDGNPWACWSCGGPSQMAVRAVVTYMERALRRRPIVVVKQWWGG